MKLIVGLGNPESRYDGTRHNIGFDIANAVAAQLKTEFKAGKGAYWFVKSSYKGVDVILQKPTTYMNLSGEAVRDAMQFYKISIADMLVVCDDLNIALGSVRLRPSGSDGGQNGLKNIIYELGRNDFARLRFGIGAPLHKGDAANFVLSKFTPDEQPIVSDTIQHCRDACLSFIEHGLPITMTRFNRKEPTVKNDR
jgi:peptidyl-tRNA hydrolase, PTH1 family